MEAPLIYAAERLREETVILHVASRLKADDEMTKLAHYSSSILI